MRWLGPGARVMLVASLLIGAGALVHNAFRPTPSVEMLIQSASTHNRDGVSRALDGGVPADAEDGWPLMLAAGDGEEKMVTLLLEHGANPARANQDGFTPLMMAAMNGQTRVIGMLIDAGADPNQPTRARQTPLGLAAMWGHDAAVALLLSRGANAAGAAASVVSPSSLSSSPMHDPPLVCAARSAIASPALLLRLIRAGADVNGTDDEGISPLAAATQTGRSDLVAVLLRCGARRHVARLANAGANTPIETRSSS